MKRQCWEHWCWGISDIQILNWIQILPLSGSCSIFCFHSFWIVAGCIIPQLHGERGWGNFMATSEESPFQSHCTYIRLSDEQQIMLKISGPEESSRNSGWYHPLWDGLLGIFICKTRKKSGPSENKTQCLLPGWGISEKNKSWSKGVFHFQHEREEIVVWVSRSLYKVLKIRAPCKTYYFFHLRKTIAISYVVIIILASNYLEYYFVLITQLTLIEDKNPVCLVWKKRSALFRSE